MQCRTLELKQDANSGPKVLRWEYAMLTVMEKADVTVMGLMQLTPAGTDVGSPLIFSLKGV